MSTSEIVKWAQAVAEEHMPPLGRRWIHVQQVVARAEHVAVLFCDDWPMLVAAAYLHDIGYAPAIAKTGFHPLDGARFLRRQGQERLARLVAHHTGAQVEASLRGLTGYLDEFPFPNSELDRALTYCDLITGPGGERVTVEQRVAEICARYGEEHPVARSARICLPEFAEVATEIEQHLATARLAGGLVARER